MISDNKHWGKYTQGTEMGIQCSCSAFHIPYLYKYTRIIHIMKWGFSYVYPWVVNVHRRRIQSNLVLAGWDYVNGNSYRVVKRSHEYGVLLGLKPYFKMGFIKSGY